MAHYRTQDYTYLRDKVLKNKSIKQDTQYSVFTFLYNIIQTGGCQMVKENAQHLHSHLILQLQQLDQKKNSAKIRAWKLEEISTIQRQIKKKKQQQKQTYKQHTKNKKLSLIIYLLHYLCKDSLSGYTA